jgi:transcriptional regulator
MKSDTVRGHLDALILAVLEDEPKHGYAVMETLRQRSRGALDLPTGSLYPAMRRLERAGMVHSEWSTVGGRERRTYRLTETGRKTLAQERAGWLNFAAIIEGVLRPAR